MELVFNFKGGYSMVYAIVTCNTDGYPIKAELSLEKTIAKENQKIFKVRLPEKETPGYEQLTMFNEEAQIPGQLSMFD